MTGRLCSSRITNLLCAIQVKEEPRLATLDSNKSLGAGAGKDEAGRAAGGALIASSEGRDSKRDTTKHV
jgi:hypothetical protein